MKGENVDELWDIYDVDRRLTGKKHRRGDPMLPGEYHLVVYVCVFNHKNQLLVQHRQPWKHGWPNMWDLSAGGSAVAGDTSQMAGQRETREEIGLDIDLSNVHPHFTIQGRSAFVDVYMVTQDADISNLCIQEEEVKEVKWVDHEELMEMVHQGIMIPHFFLDKIFEIKNQYGSKLKSVNGITVQKAVPSNLISWMNLVEVVQPDFYGLETKKAMEEYENTVRACINEQTAICATEDARVLGILLYSKKDAKIGCLAVHPEYRRKKIGSRMIEEMLKEFGPDQDITVETYRKEEKMGTAARAFYKKLGFKEGKLTEAMGHPVQEFVRKGRKSE